MKGNSTATTPEEYLETLAEPRKSELAQLDALIREVAPNLDRHIQSGMLAYGKYHYKYASGREGDWFRIGLASQKNYISLYACGMKDGAYVAEAYRERLPKASIGRSCVRFKRVGDLDPAVLRELIEETVRSDFAT